MIDLIKSLTAYTGVRRTSPPHYFVCRLHTILRYIADRIGNEEKTMSMILALSWHIQTAQLKVRITRWEPITLAVLFLQY